MDDAKLRLPDWFEPLRDAIAEELEQLSQSQHDRRPALEHEAAELQSTLNGWALSLAKPNLNASLREDLESQYGQAKARLREIESDLANLGSRQTQHQRLVEPQQVLDGLRRLDEVLGSGNVAQGNLELSRHIERIDVHTDGQVVMRTSKLGIFDGAAALLARPSESAAPAESTSATKRIHPRRRGRLKIDEPLSGGVDPLCEAQPSNDPGRFVNLESKWFWEDVFEIPGLLCWAAEHAAQVAERREQGWTIARLMAHFGRAKPTIRHALQIAAERGLTPPPTANGPIEPGDGAAG